MRVLITVDPEIPVPPIFYGGIERIAAGLITELRAHGHEVALLAHPESSAVVDRLYTWPVTESRSALNYRNMTALLRATRNFKPDLVHSFSRLLYLLPLLATELPRVMSFQRRPTRRTVAWSARMHGRLLAFTGCSESVCREGRAAGGNWTAIPNFADTEKFRFRGEVAANAPLLFLSRVERIKGAHTAIAVARATDRKLIIAGNHSESGSDGDYWRREIAPHLDAHVEYVGPVNDEQKIALLQNAAAMIVPIEWEEPFGIVFAESLACGTPVISCPRGALPEIVRDGVEGFLGTTTAQLAAAVERIPTIARQDCRSRAETCFSASVVSSNYERLYLAMQGRAARESVAAPRSISIQS